MARALSCRDGYVLTNNHVVGENRLASADVTVALADKRELGAIVGTDPATDIALLKMARTTCRRSWGDS